MNIKDDLKTSCTFVGTLIGAGFATGQEVLLFFGSCSFIVPMLAGILCGASAFVFARIGNITEQNPISAMFPQTEKPWKIAIDASNFFVVAAMIACAEETIFGICSFHGGGIMVGILALISTCIGTKYIKLINTIIVPFILLTICIMLIVDKPPLKIDGEYCIKNAFLYVGMNILTGGSLVSKMTKNSTNKDAVMIGAVTATLMTVLLLAVFALIKNSNYTDKPLLKIASSLHLGGPCNLIVLCAIFTTCVGGLCAIGDGSKTKLTLVTALAFIISLIGFGIIVETTYPVSGVIGTLYLIFAVCFLIYKFIYKKKALMGVFALDKRSKRWYNILW